MCLFLCQPHAASAAVALRHGHYSHCLQSLWVSGGVVPAPLLFLDAVVAVPGLLQFCVHLGIICSSSATYAVGVLMGIVLHLYIALSSLDSLVM